MAKWCGAQLWGVLQGTFGAWSMRGSGGAHPAPRPHATVAACPCPSHPLPTQHPTSTCHAPTPCALCTLQSQPSNTSHGREHGPLGGGAWHEVTWCRARSGGGTPPCGCILQPAGFTCSRTHAAVQDAPLPMCPVWPVASASKHSPLRALCGQHGWSTTSLS